MALERQRDWRVLLVMPKSPVLSCFAALLLLSSVAHAEKVCGVYTAVIDFAGPDARQRAIDAQSPFLMEKHKRVMQSRSGEANFKLALDCGFNTLFMTLYPLAGKDWWDIPAARGLIADALV